MSPTCPTQLAWDLKDTLGKLRAARLDSDCAMREDAPPHYGCQVCTLERRLNWLLDRVERA